MSALPASNGAANVSALFSFVKHSLSCRVEVAPERHTLQEEVSTHEKEA
jgi:hypothetical protein